MDKPTLADATYRTHAQARKDAEGPAAPVKFFSRLTKKPWVAHLIRMFGRDAARLGGSFAAAITYFTLASLVPILGLAFSVTGIVLNSQPDLIAKLKEQVTTVFASSGGEFSDSISKVIDTAVDARWAVGVVSLVLGLYTGIGWMTNIRTAVQAQWRPKWEVAPEDQDTFLGGLRKDLTALIVLGLGFLVSVILSTIGTALTGVFARLLGLDDVGWVTAVLSIVPILLALCVSIGLFYFIYTFLPVHSDEVPKRKIWRGAIAAAIIFELFKLLLSTLLQLLGGSASVAAFGSIIVLLAIVNLIARMVLLVAAWIGTSEAPAVPELEDDLAVVIRPNYQVRSAPALAGGLGLGVAAGWVVNKVRRHRT